MPGQVGMDAALHAHLGGARTPTPPRRGRPPRRSVSVYDSGVDCSRWANAQKRQPDVADVREVDVPVDDVGDLVADGLGAQVVGDAAERIQRRPLRAEQRERLVVGDRAVTLAPSRSAALDVGVQALGAGGRVVAPRARDLEGVEVAVDRRRRPPAARRRRPSRTSARSSAASTGRRGPATRSARGACPSTAQPVGARAARRPARASCRRDTDRAARRTRVDREALAQRPCRAPPWSPASASSRGPRLLGVHVVGRERRHAAPVVDARVEQPQPLCGSREVRRGLQVMRGPSTTRAVATAARNSSSAGSGAWRIAVPASPGSSGR